MFSGKNVAAAAAKGVREKRSRTTEVYDVGFHLNYVIFLLLSLIEYHNNIGAPPAHEARTWAEPHS